ncbi:hypothetical protein LDENG_00195470 [Lucifuga dentata]|nr:hypothetical protein LDENG_00195470 [Lucifuga dentata]
MWCPSWLLGSSVVLILLCPPGTLRPGCLSIWGVPPGHVASVGLGEVPLCLGPSPTHQLLLRSDLKP